MFYVKISTKMKDDIDRLLDAVEHPERFSDEELEKMFEDSETFEMYRLMGRTAYALTDTPEPDIDKEWQDFAKERSGACRGNALRSFTGIFSRNAAAVLICVGVSLAVVAATIGVRYSMRHSEELEEITSVAESDLSGVREVEVEADAAKPITYSATTPEQVIFMDEPLEKIISEIAAYYEVEVSYKSDSARQLRLYFQWDQSLGLEEVVNQLDSFDQIRIELSDNALTIE